MGSIGRVVFSKSRFLADVENACKITGSPFSKARTTAAVQAFHESFTSGAVLWRLTDRPGGSLNYRFYSRRHLDTVSIATQAGFIKPYNKLGQLITSLSARYQGTAPQSCDFDTELGLTKTWVFLGGTRPVADVLAVDAVPESIRRCLPTFQRLGLEGVRHVAVDYAGETVNLYFNVPGSLSTGLVTDYVGLAGHPPVSDADVEELRPLFNPDTFTFAVTMDYSSGEIKRVGFYALNPRLEDVAALDPSFRRFFNAIPMYDEEAVHVVAWSFGKAGKRYIKVERSYCGEWLDVMKSWGGPRSS